jgi:hypothetical protein
MKKFMFICLVAGICSQGFAQGSRTVDSLNNIINNNHNAPETRVLACILQGEYYINKPNRDQKDVDSTVACLYHGERLSRQLNVHNTNGEFLFLSGLISKQKSRQEGNRLNDQALVLLRKEPGSELLGRALLEKGD